VRRFIGANRGRGQVYPTGDKTNNNLFNAVAGKIQEIKTTDKTMKLLLLQLVEKQKYKQYQKN
jgi:apocytochrome f